MPGGPLPNPAKLETTPDAVGKQRRDHIFLNPCTIRLTGIPTIC
jgi:hypothetical protein